MDNLLLIQKRCLHLRDKAFHFPPWKFTAMKFHIDQITNRKSVDVNKSLGLPVQRKLTDAYGYQYTIEHYGTPFPWF